MFHRVLVALDGTTSADAVLRPVVSLVGPGSEIVLLHVLPEPPSHPPDRYQAWLKLREDIEDYLHGMVLPGFSGRPGTFVDIGDPVERILSVARGMEADLVALCTRSWRNLPKPGLGSVCRELVRRSDRTNLFVPPGWAPRGNGPVRILLPLESPGWASSDVEFIRPVAEGSKTEVTILHVETSQPDPLEGQRTDPPLHVAADDRRRRFSEAAERLLSFGIDANSMETWGDPVRQIVEQAASLGASCIAMTTHGRRGLERLIVGSVAESVIRDADRPVLLFRRTPVSGDRAASEVTCRS